MYNFGFAFGDVLAEGKKRERKHTLRLAAMGVLGVGLVVLVVGRLVQLQVVHGRENRQRAEENRVVVHEIEGPRGAIFDRNGEPLTRNIPIFKLPITNDGKTTWKILTREEYEEAKKKGEEVVEGVGREYIYPEAMAHVIGYVGEISPEEIENKECRIENDRDCYQPGDYVGKLGIESVFETALRGKDGGEVVERGPRGEKLRTLAVQQPRVGSDVKLTIDAGLQRKATEILDGRRGAVVASDPRTGEILVLVSSPTFDPNVFSDRQQGTQNGEAKFAMGQVGDKRQEILTSPDKPLFNRASAGLYPPGSVFKIVTAVAGLLEKAIDEETVIEDTGEIKVGVFRYGNWYFDQYGRTEGEVDIVKALQRSNDIFFYKTGERVGAEKIAAWAERFGYGKEVGLGLGSEALGVVPSPAWKERVKGERWFLGNTYHYAIGQGDLQVTPLQVQQMTSVIAANGKKCKLRITNYESRITNQQCEDLGISKQTLELVREGMVAACATGGTAFPFFDFKPQVACKTGTAQFGPPAGGLDRTHAWFTVMAPSDDPQIVITVLLEAAGEGSYQAAPVARKLLDYWFHER